MKDERRPICEVVAESIERLIIDGVLKVGQPLPSDATTPSDNACAS